MEWIILLLPLAFAIVITVTFVVDEWLEDHKDSEED
jgi:hypothetical protein